ncbi:hypothetical protein [Dactylosporangium sp. NPDC051541]|uniref:hypothetical protein n=1 Tax=Dactylosporangium sp. NPDC051541 TaxID=3363977 RepID=UPI0037B81B29
MRRTILRLLGLAIAATALITYINWAGNRDEARFNPAGQLQCTQGAQIAGAQATTAPTARESRSPDQLADAWAKARNPELVAGKHRLFASDDRVDIGFDRKAHTVAVLTFRTDGRLGWHLDAVVACQTQAVNRSPAPDAS